MSDLQKAEDELNDTYGMAFLLSGSGVTLHARYFAALAERYFAVCFDTERKHFFRYNPTHGVWEPWGNEAIIDAISGMIHEYAVINEAFQAQIEIKATSGFLSSVLTFLKGVTAFQFSSYKRGDYLIHAANTMLRFDLSSGRWQTEPFSPSYHSLNYLPISYDPAATCPRFLNRLLTPAMSPADIELLQLYAGQALLGMNISQTILLLTGTAGGGKSTLVNVIEGLVGRWNCTELRTEFLNTRFENSRMLGKTLLTAKDVPGNFLNTAGAQRLKALTGKDTVTLEYKNSNEAFDIAGVFNAIITSNSTLQLRFEGDEDAWRRRLLWISYERPPVSAEERIVDLDRILLEEEGSGILNWAMEGARKLLQRGGKMVRDGEQKRRIDQLIAGSSPYDTFVARCVVKNPDRAITTEELVCRFKDFSKTMGWTIPSDRKIENELPGAMFRVHGAHKRTDIRRKDGKYKRGYMYFSVNSGI